MVCNVTEKEKRERETVVTSVCDCNFNDRNIGFETYKQFVPYKIKSNKKLLLML